MKKLNVVIAALVILAVGSSAFAFGPGFGRGEYGEGGHPCAMRAGFGHGHHPGLYGPRMAQALNLSKEQMDRMWDLQTKSFKEMRGLRYDLLQKRMEIRTMYTDPSVNEAAIITKQKEINSLREKLRDGMVQLKLEQRRVLTPEQLKKLKELQAGHGPGRGFGHGNGKARYWG